MRAKIIQKIDPILPEDVYTCISHFHILSCNAKNINMREILKESGEVQEGVVRSRPRTRSCGYANITK